MTDFFFSVADQLGSRRLVGTIKRQLEGCNTCTCAGSSLPRRSNKFNCKWVKVQVFCPVEQALAGSKDNEFRWCIRNTSKKIGLGIHRRDWGISLFELILLECTLQLQTRLGLLSCLSLFLFSLQKIILDEKSHWQHSYRAMHNVKVAHCLRILFAVGKVPGELNTFLFFFFRGKQRTRKAEPPKNGLWCEIELHISQTKRVFKKIDMRFSFWKQNGA